jgi:biotin carboxyl carrier protein
VWMKKRYVLDIDGEQHRAVIARRGDETTVQVTDESDPVAVDYEFVLGGKAVSVRLNGRQHLVHLSSVGDSVAATLAGRPQRLTVMDELRAQALESLGSAAGSGTISADIPGLVVEIKVEEGQKVHQGEPVIVVEAMKMQNELCAGVGGTVASIPVKAGQTVNPGDVLVVIEPEPGG